MTSGLSIDPKELTTFNYRRLLTVAVTEFVRCKSCIPNTEMRETDYTNLDVPFTMEKHLRSHAEQAITKRTCAISSSGTCGRTSRTMATIAAVLVSALVPNPVVALLRKRKEPPDSRLLRLLDCILLSPENGHQFQLPCSTSPCPCPGTGADPDPDPDSCLIIK